MTMGGKPAQTYDLLGDQGGARIHVTRYVMLSANVGYVLTLTGSEAEASAFAAQAQVIVSTFAFADP